MVHNINSAPQSVVVGGNPSQFDWDKENNILKIIFDWNSIENKNVKISL